MKIVELRFAVEIAELERSFIELEASKSGFISNYCNLLHKRQQLELFEREIVFRINVLRNNKHIGG